MTNNTGLDIARNLINEYDETNKKILEVSSILRYNHSVATKLLNNQGRFVDLFAIDPELGANMKNIIDTELHEQLRKYKSRLKEIENQLGGVK